MGKFEIFTDAGIDNLRYAIVRQACRDYYAMAFGKENTYSKKQIEAFFRSDYFKMLCSIPAQVLIDEIKYRAKNKLRLFRIEDDF